MTTELREKLQEALSNAYDIERELLGGGMSRVFVAVERALARRVVIKVLPPELAAGVNTERFRREIQLSAQLHHPHIVPVLSAGELGDILYYTMPYIEGESLASAVRHGQRMDVREVFQVLHDVVDALAYAHDHGVIHRDIKPGNILRLGVHSLVTDFGVAKAISAALPSSGLTSGGFAIGTPAYMAPEQLAADPLADHRVDIYAIGLLAYELLNGISPFLSTSPQATMAAQLTRVPQPLDKIRDDVPPMLSGIVQRCLEKLPENRPSSARKLLELLEEAQALYTGSISSPRHTAEWATPRRKGRSVALMGAMVLLVAAGTFGITRLVDNEREARTAMAAPASDASVGNSASGAIAIGDTPGVSIGSAQRLPTTDLDAMMAMKSPQGAASQDAEAQLSRNDSLQIAAAIRNQMLGSLSLADSLRMADSLQLEIERRVLDSMRAVLLMFSRDSLPPLGGRGGGGRGGPGGPGGGGSRLLNDAMRPLEPGEKRVLVLDLRGTGGSPELSLRARALSDTLRRALENRPEYSVVDPRALRQLTQFDSRTLATLTRAGAVVTGSVGPSRSADSVVVRLTISDPQIGQREGRPFEVRTVHRDSVDAAVATLLQPIMERLTGITWPVPSRGDLVGRGRGGRSGRGGRGAVPPDTATA